MFKSNLKIFNYRKFLSALLIFVLVIITFTGCTKSLRQDATKIAQAGSVISKQMADFYTSLQQDTVNTYELNAFREAYLLQKSYDEQVAKAKAQGMPIPPPPDLGMSATDIAIFQEYQKTYQALAARIRLANAMQAAYTSYSHLSEYDSTKEVLDSADGLIKTVGAAASFSLPDPTGTVGSIVQGLFKDIISELETIRQNRKLLGESNRLIPILEKLKKIFDAERVLYGGDTVVKDSMGVDRKISGIAGRRAATYKSVARQLVESDAVISTSMVNRVLSQYDLHFPEPQVPFTQPALKSGIIKIIESRAYPLAQLSEDIGEKLSKGLGNLITLHNQLAVKKPLDLSTLVENSATAQVLLDQLKTQGIPSDFIIELLKAIQNKGAKQ